MQNKRTRGTCSNCKNESTRLFDPPLLAPPAGIYERKNDYLRGERVPLDEYNDGERLKWLEPGGHGGAEIYYVKVIEERRYLVHWELEGVAALCWRCWTCDTWPSLFPFVANKPAEIALHGWWQPRWLPRSARAAVAEAEAVEA